MCGARARAGTMAVAVAVTDGQEAESDGEEEAACAEPDSAQVPAEEAEESVHNLVHRV